MRDEFFPRIQRQPRHFWADNEIIDAFGHKLKPHALAVYMALARAADNDTGECRISMSKIATRLGMSKGGVFNAIRLIVGLRLAKVVQAGNNRRCATYVLADVKKLTGVQPMNETPDQSSPHERSVRPVNPSDHPANAAFVQRTRNKENKTFFQDLQDSSSKDRVCPKCQNLAIYPHPGHPGQMVLCSCPAAEGLMRQEMGPQRIAEMEPEERLV